MEEKPTYRHELKYAVSTGEYLALRQRLRAVMLPDAHAGPDGKYRIRSVYFDNADDKALREKNDGAPQREKFRIRYYNDKFSYITLEKKIKHNQLCMKVDAPVTLEECRALLSGDRAWMLTHPSPLVRELYCKMKTQQLRPRVLVSYVREPYIYRLGNVRVTFDSQIRTSLFHQRFWEESPRDVSATDRPEDMILEVKYDAFLPDVIACLIQTGSTRQQSFSKYGACRRFG